MHTIQIGMTGKHSLTVTDDLTASHMGSGSVAVYATPAMIALMEAAAVNAIESALSEGVTSVGTAIAITHTAATPPGQTVHAEAEVTAVDGRQISFSVRAYDEHEIIGEGTHRRAVIDRARFMQRVQSKNPDSSSS